MNKLRENWDAPGGATNTLRGLTHSSELTREGLAVEPTRNAIVERMALAAVPNASGCLIWQRATNSRGYGVIWFDGKLRLAHRVAWFLKHGTWPASEFVLDHICEIKACINADHLRELENWQNLRRAHARGDVATEHRRAIWRRANAKRRGTYRYTEGGG